jgi:peroxiredoxin Q/BCP
MIEADARANMARHLGSGRPMAMVKEGRAAPEFTLPSSSGAEVSLSDLRGKTVVLYFYPRDNTPGCTREACAFREAMSQMKRRGAVVLGVSPDSLAAHDKFSRQHGLNFPLLSDPDKKVARKYGAFGEKVMYGKKVKGMIRSTFIIDPQGIVRKTFPKVKVDGHAEEVLEALKALS